MDEKLYEKVLEVLILGHLRYKDSLGGFTTPEDFALDYDLRNDYSVEDVAGVIREFIEWHKTCENNEKE